MSYSGYLRVLCCFVRTISLGSAPPPYVSCLKELNLDLNPIQCTYKHCSCMHHHSLLREKGLGFLSQWKFMFIWNERCKLHEHKPSQIFTLHCVVKSTRLLESSQNLKVRNMLSSAFFQVLQSLGSLCRLPPHLFFFWKMGLWKISW